MAHIQDRWEPTIDGQRVRTARYGKGKRWHPLPRRRYRVPKSLSDGPPADQAGR